MYELDFCVLLTYLFFFPYTATKALVPLFFFVIVHMVLYSTKKIKN